MSKLRGGYAGKQLWVDLSGRHMEVRPTEFEFANEYVGGRGFTSRIQYEKVKPDTDPLGPENVLIFAAGPVVGTQVPGSSRTIVAGRSPLTGILGDSSMGGNFAPALKFAGWDLLVFEGRADSPVYLLIDNDKVEIKDARHLWGKDFFETEEILKAELGSDVKVAGIGQAGENLVKFASVMSNHRAAGRAGMGAVMGSKNLKAVAVRGTGKVKIANPIALEETAKQVRDILFNDPHCQNEVRTLGTTMWFKMFNDMGGVSTKNRQTGYFAPGDKISGETLVKKYLYSEKSCWGCILRCEKVVAVPDGKYKSIPTKIEFFTLASFGSNCMNDNLESILKANEYANRYGFDTAEGGQVIAFAMECYDRGLITKADTGGIDLTWGNSDAVVELAKKIAFREGFGAVLAEGTRGAAQIIGKGSEAFSVDIKGQTIDAMDPRVWKVYSSRLRTSSRGGCHCRGQGPLGKQLDHMPLEKGVARLIYNEYICMLASMVGVCQFVYSAYSADFDRVMKKVGALPGLYSAVTGFDADMDYLWERVERAHNVERMLNVRLGMRRKDDDMPRRFREEALPDGPYAGQRYDINDEFIEEYYRQRGWEVETGIPTREKLESLGLHEESREIEGLRAS